MTDMTGRMNRHLDDVRPSGIRRFTALARATEGCAMLTIGEPDFDTPEEIKAAAVRALQNNRTHYPMNAGDPDVRRAVSEFEARTHGLNYAPDEILLTCGASEAIYTAMTGVLNPGDEVILPQPAFGLYETDARLAGAKIIRLDTAADGFQIHPDKLARAITDKTKLIVLNSPNNPTGVVYSRDTLAGVRRAIGDRPIFVLSDDVYLGLHYDADCPVFAAEYAELSDRLLVAQSFSKPYAMTGWRLGYLLGRGAVIERLKLIHASAVVSVASFSQDACIRALAPNMDARVRETVDIYRARRDLICGRLAAMGLSHVRPGGAFYVFPDIARFGMDAETFCLRAIREGGVAGVPGSCFGAEGYLRLSYCYAADEIERAMDRLEKFIATL